MEFEDRCDGVAGLYQGDHRSQGKRQIDKNTVQILKCGIGLENWV